jgi:hypothetical protein
VIDQPAETSGGFANGTAQPIGVLRHHDQLNMVAHQAVRPYYWSRTELTQEAYIRPSTPDSHHQRKKPADSAHFVVSPDEDKPPATTRVSLVTFVLPAMLVRNSEYCPFISLSSLP